MLHNPGVIVTQGLKNKVLSDPPSILLVISGHFWEFCLKI